MILNSVVYYLFSVSAVMIYGIGIRNTIFCPSTKKLALTVFELLFCCLSSACGSYLICVYVLAPLKLCELYSVVCLLIYLFFAIINSLIFQRRETSLLLEVSFPCVLIAVCESTSLVQCVIIVLCCTLSYCLIMVLSSAIKERLKTTNATKYFNSGSLVYISFAVLIIAFYAINISWLNLLR